jgi:nitrous oxide reductase accessory protein NosL
MNDGRVAVRLNKSGRVVWLDNEIEARDFAEKFDGRVIGYDDSDD